MTPLLPDIDFRDSSILEFNLSERLDSIRIALFAPNAHQGAGAVFRFTFNAVLKFQFETVGIGEPETWIELHDVYILREEEWKRWKERLHLLSTGDSFGNYSPLSRFGFTEVFHVVLEGVFYRGIEPTSKLEGIEIVCRSIEGEDVTEEWDIATFQRPHRIPAAEQEREDQT